MLAIISDLHLCDGTASGNVSPRAFALLLDELHDLARRYRARDLDLVFLGDVFDLLRSERWFVDRKGGEVPLGERPWGTARMLAEAPAPRAVLDRARAIAEETAETNREALAVLRGEDPSCPVPDGLTVRRVFLPGNHDRLYLHDHALRLVIRQALGAVDERALVGEGIHQHRIEVARYGLLARHGHEFDEWNFERYRPDTRVIEYVDEDYLYTPIGDPITTELVARLPFEVRRRLCDAPLFRDEPALQDRIIGRLQRIEDVRPLFASFRWFFFQVGHLNAALRPEQAHALGDIINDAVRAVADNFVGLEWVGAWRDQHNRPLRFDASDGLALALELLRHFDARAVAHLLDRATSLVGSFDRHRSLVEEAAAERLDHLPPGRRFIVYGHIHNPERFALRAEASGEDLYLNSGTWRERAFQTHDGRGFVTSELFSYLVFADRHETQLRDGYPGGDRKVPAFIAWSGARRV